MAFSGAARVVHRQVRGREAGGGDVEVRQP